MNIAMRTDLEGLKRNWWDSDLSDYFSMNGRGLSDSEVRSLVEYALDHGYRYDTDIPGDELEEAVRYKKGGPDEHNG